MSKCILFFDSNAHLASLVFAWESTEMSTVNAHASTSTGNGYGASPNAHASTSAGNGYEEDEEPELDGRKRKRKRLALSCSECKRRKIKVS